MKTWNYLSKNTLREVKHAGLVEAATEAEAADKVAAMHPNCPITVLTEQRRPTMKTQIAHFVEENGITIHVQPAIGSPDQWSVSLSYRDKQCFFLFANPTKPTAEEVLAQLVEESSVLHYSLSDWCDDRGWNDDSKMLYEAYMEQTHELKRCLGREKFEELLTKGGQQ